MAISEPKLVIVTLTRDNLSQLELTLRSVARQTERPTRHLVIDGSSPPNAKKAKELTLVAGAEYLWREPNGIYEAMDYSLSLLDSVEYALWLNSSDWLAGPRVIERIFSELTESGQDCDWLVGQLLRRGKRELGFHRYLSSEKEFSRQLVLGWAGFPHPSTVISARAVREAGGFAEGSTFAVARDYDLALRILKKCGEPRIVNSVFSVHVPEGFTSRQLLTGFLERFQSRILRLPFSRKVLAVALLPVLLCLAVYRKTEAQVPHNSIEVSAKRIAGHFCEEKSIKDWPFCCDEPLKVADTYPNLAGI